MESDRTSEMGLERLSSLLDASPDAIFLVGAPHGEIHDASGSAERLCGLPRTVLKRRRIDQLLQEPGGQQLDALLRRGDPPPALRAELLGPDGATVPVEMTVGFSGVGESRCALVVARDIRAQLHAELALQHSEQRARELADLLPAIVFEMNTRGTLTFANQWGFRMSGYDEQDLAAGFEAVQLLVPAERPRAREGIGRALSEASRPGTEYSHEYTVMRKDGSTFPALFTSTPMVQDGRVVGVRGLVVDISERKRKEEEARRRDENLRQVQKLEMLGRLTGGIAHDFNNLLTAILGYSDLLLHKIGPSPAQRLEVEGIKQAALRAAALTQQLLVFSRKQTAQPQVLDLDEQVVRARRMIGRLIGEDIDLQFVPSGAPLPVQLDPSQLDQVLINLAVNARDAMPGGGRLELRTARVELDAAAQAAHPGASPGPHVQLVVSDSGSGMDETVREHLFEPFFTTKEPGRGTGLGLSTVFGIVQQNHGWIEVQSRPGEGSTFSLFFPLASGPLPVVPPPLAEVPSGKETVLLVEDEEGVRSLTRMMLEKSGYKVIEAAHGAEALDRLRHHPERIDLLLTDVVMPGLNGRELYERLLVERDPTLKVLYVSGYTSDLLDQTGVADQGAGFLQKPFTYEMLACKVREVLGKG